MSIPEPPSRDLQAILDRIDAEEHAARVAVFEQCDDCVSYDEQAMCDPEPRIIWAPCARHRKEGR